MGILKKNINKKLKTKYKQFDIYIYTKLNEYSK